MNSNLDYKKIGDKIRDYLAEHSEFFSVEPDSSTYKLPQTEENIEEVNLYFHNLLQDIKDGIVISSGKKILFVSKSITQMTGYTLPDLISANPFKILYPEDIGFAKEILERRFGHFKPNSFSTRIYTKSRELKWIEINTWHTHIGDKTCAIDFVEDITSTKTQEIQKSVYSRRLQLALDATNDAIYDDNILTGETWVNARWYEMLGYKTNEIELSNGKWRDLIHPQDREMVDKLGIERTRPEKIYNEMEFRLRTKTGSYLWILSRGRAVEWDEDNIPIRVIGTHVDISDFKRTSQLLSLQRDIVSELSQCTKLEDSMEILLERISQLNCIECGRVYLFDKDKNIFNLVKHRGLSKTFTDHIKRLTPPHGLQKQLENGESICSPYILLNHDDPIRIAEGLKCVSINPILNNGKLIGIVNCGSKTQEMISDQSQKVIESLVAYFGTLLSRIQSEIKTQESEKHYRTLFTSVPFGIGLLDFNGKILDFNSHFQNMFEYSANELKDFNIETIFKDLFTKNEVISLLNSYSIIKDKEISFIKKSGVEIFAKLSARIIEKDGENLILALFQNITVDKYWKMENEKAQQSKRALLAAIPDMILRFDKKGRIVEFKQAEDFDPYTSPTSFLGKQICDVLPKDVCEQLMDKITICLNTGRTTKIIYELEINGKPRTYEGRVSAISISQGYVVIRDITDINK